MVEDLHVMREKKLPHCTASDFGVSIRPDAPDPEMGQRFIDALDAYLHTFAAPIERDGDIGGVLLSGPRCPSCANTLGGALGSFSWGIQNSEGQCSCGWPCRALHRPKDGKKEIFDKPVAMILAYHPDAIEERGQA